MAGRLLIALLVVGPAVARAEVVDRVAAVVNNDIITLSEVQARAGPELARTRLSSDPARRAEQKQELMQKALDALIGDKLMEAQIKELGIEVTDAEIELSIDDVKKGQSLSQEQFETALAQEGYTLSSYRAFLRRFLSRSKLINLKVRSKVKVSDEDLKSEYVRFAKDESQDFEVRARQIVVPVPKTATPEQVEAARKKAAALAEEARRPGADFAELARKRSEGASAADGGDLGYFRRRVMQPAFDRVAFTLNVGEVSEPVRTEIGWHVLTVVDRRALEAPPFEEVKEQLKERLLRTQLERYSEQYVAELRAQAVVQDKLNPAATAQRAPVKKRETP